MEERRKILTAMLHLADETELKVIHAFLTVLLKTRTRISGGNEMIVISQDRERFTDAQSFAIVANSRSYMIQTPGGMIMGNYIVREYAEEVLMGIATAIANGEEIFFMPGNGTGACHE